MRLTKTPLIYSVSRFNLGLGALFGGDNWPRLHQKLRDRDSRLEVRDRDSRLQNLSILPKFFKKMSSSLLTMGVRRGVKRTFPPPWDWN